MKIYTCEGCGKHVEDDEFVGPLEYGEEPKVILADYPNMDPGTADFIRRLSADRGEVPEPVKKYHRTFVWTRGYGCACCGGHKPTLCGPLHEETQEEYYVRMASNG